VDLLIPVDPAEIFDLDSPEIAQDTLGLSNTKKTEEVHDLDNASINIASISPEKGGDDAYLNDTKVEN
jgi:hypothetical protein